jgi:quercetin dioxygenase-like cupin family protein
MNNWIKKDGYDTCLQATGENLSCSGTEIHLIRFREGKFSHYHRDTTEFFHITAGKGRILLDGRVRRLFPGASFIIQPHVRHTFINDLKDQLLEAVMVKTNTHPEDTFIA